MVKTKIILSIISIVIIILIVLNVYIFHKWNQRKEYKQTKKIVQMILTNIILLILCFVVFIPFSLNVYDKYQNWKEEKELIQANKEVQIILENELTKAEKLFNSNEKEFQSTVKDIKNLPTYISNMNNDFDIHISTERDHIIFSLFNDCIHGCFVRINLIFTKTNNFESSKNLIKLKDNWYLQKEILWGT